MVSKPENHTGDRVDLPASQTGLGGGDEGNHHQRRTGFSPASAHARHAEVPRPRGRARDPRFSIGRAGGRWDRPGRRRRRLSLRAAYRAYRGARPIGSGDAGAQSVLGGGEQHRQRMGGARASRRAVHPDEWRHDLRRYRHHHRAPVSTIGDQSCRRTPGRRGAGRHVRRRRGRAGNRRRQDHCR